MDLDRAMKVLNEHFDAFMVLGSMYSPATGLTEDTIIKKGNKHTLRDMINDLYIAEMDGELIEREDEDDG